MSNNKKNTDDNILLKIYRQFTKDEAVGELISRYREKEIEVGQLKSEIEFLEYKLEEVDLWIKDMNRYKKGYRQSMKGTICKDILEDITEENTNLRSKNRMLKIDYDKLLHNYAKLQLNTNSNEED